MSGWIKLHRSLNDHWINERRIFSKYEAWLDILMNVNYEDKKALLKGKLYEVKRGQSILSIESWAKRFGWDRSSVRRFFKLLQKEGMILLVSDNKTTHLTVCNYDSYQGKEPAEDQQTPIKKPSKDNQKATPKEGKEEKESKEIKKIDFSVFWDLYDRKKGSKQNCEKMWNDLNFETQTKIIEFIPKFLKTISEKKYQVYPERFLKYERWNDEIEPTIEYNKGELAMIEKALAKKAKGWSRQDIIETYKYDIETNEFTEKLNVW